jgi:hypothetical protein
MERWTRLGRVVFSSALIGMIVGACTGSSSEDGAKPVNNTGQSCTSNSDCPGGFCVTVMDRTPLEQRTSSSCSMGCERDSDCTSDFAVTLQCATLPDGSKGCATACNGGFAPPGYVCQNGSPVACEIVGEQYCEACGCPMSLRCKPGEGCVAKSDVGGDCAFDHDCRSNNCSTFGGVCRVPLGSACDGTNCDRCLTHAGGWSYCSRDCDSEYDCQGGHCVSYSFNLEYVCQPPCKSLSDASCPGDCDYPPGSTDFIYCFCPDCGVQGPQRQLGQRCSFATECESGECLSYAKRCAGLDGCAYEGLCTTSCTDSASCGGSLVCVDIPCASGETTTCGQKCLPRCSPESTCKVGFCQQLIGAEGPIAVCGAKVPIDGFCRADDDCQSSRCLNQHCAIAGGT